VLCNRHGADGLEALQCCWCVLLVLDAAAVYTHVRSPRPRAMWLTNCCCLLGSAQDDGDTIDPALRVVAYSMEEGNWELVAWMINHHASAELGPYFLPAIAQVGAAAGCLLAAPNCEAQTQVIRQLEPVMYWSSQLC
jgi:hypothetical protein